MAPGARVQDALEKAGGATAIADLAQINLAAPLVDGSQLYVPEKGKSLDNPINADYREGIEGVSVARYSAHSRSSRGASRSKKAPPPASISLNTASLGQLQQLPGVGPATARQIVEYRKTHGPFRSIDELLVLKGIGPKKLAKMREFVKL
jgi:competence protein ComEA